MLETRVKYIIISHCHFTFNNVFVCVNKEYTNKKAPEQYSPMQQFKPRIKSIIQKCIVNSIQLTL